MAKTKVEDRGDRNSGETVEQKQGFRPFPYLR